MLHKELIFKPTRKTFFKRSPIYIISMWTKSLFLCTEYLMKAVTSGTDVLTTDKYIERFWRVHMQSSMTTLYRTGIEYLNPHETYVFMSNHESWMDIPAMFATVPSSLRMVSKAGLMQLPIVGHAMYNAGFIAIDRQNRSRAIKQLEHAKDRLNKGISIWMAPEGTRSRDGSLAPFKKGGFHLARDLGKSIVPVYIEGAGDVMPADGMWIYPNRSITVHFCKPISTEGYDRGHTDELIQKVRQAMLDKKHECQKQSRSFGVIDDTL